MSLSMENASSSCPSASIVCGGTYTCYEDALSSRKLDEDIIPRGPWGFICGGCCSPRPMGYILECVYMYLVGS